MPTTPGELPVITTQHLAKLNGGIDIQEVMPIPLGEIQKRTMAVALMKAVSPSFKGLRSAVGQVSERIFDDCRSSNPEVTTYVYELARRAREDEVQGMIANDPILYKLANKLARRALRRQGKGVDIYSSNKRDIFEGLAIVESPEVVYRDIFELLEAKLDKTEYKWKISFRIPVLTNAMFCALLYKHSTDIDLLKPLLTRIERRTKSDAGHNITYTMAIFERSKDPEFLATLNNTKYIIIGKKLDVLAQKWVRENKDSPKHAGNIPRDLFAEFAILYFPES